MHQLASLLTELEYLSVAASHVELTSCHLLLSSFENKQTKITQVSGQIFRRFEQIQKHAVTAHAHKMLSAMGAGDAKACWLLDSALQK